MADSAAINAISRGALRAIFEKRDGEKPTEPVLQCVQIKPMEIKDPSQPARYRVIWNDIDNFIQSMLAVQANHIITDGHLKKGSICRLKGFQPNQVKDKKILIILDVEILKEYGEQEKIGQPVALDNVLMNQGAASNQPGNISSNGFYGQQQQQQQQGKPQQQQNSKSLPTRQGQGGGAANNGNLYPIEALSPYAHRWTIRARITSKSDIKSWHNKNGEGRLFSVNLLDESGEIRATAFSSTNEQFDQLYEMLQEGSVFYISSPCQVKMAKRQFSQVNNDYELTFERDTRVERADDQDSVPQVRYNFTSIGDLGSVEKDTTIDTIGVLKDVGEVNQITSKTTSKPYDKRDLTLVDSSMHSVRLTIWGSAAAGFDAPLESVVAFKGVKVSDFGGRSLSLLASGSMSVNPDIDEAHKLKGWFDAQGNTDNFATHANLSTGTTGTTKRDAYKTIAEIKDENLGMSETPDYFSIKATIVFIRKENVSYPACRSPDCNKKVLEIDPGVWRCEKCDKTFDRPEYRYVLSFNVSDHTGHLWLSAFDSDGRMIMGMTADELYEIESEGDDKKKSEAFDAATCKTYIFRCSAKMDNFRDEQRVRYQVKGVQQLNFSTEAAKLADMIKQYNIGSNNDGLFVR